MKCPKCGSNNVQFSTYTKTSSFSFLDACCGTILMGPLGLLCGLCGIGSKTKESWICLNCGHTFSYQTGLKNTQQEQQRVEDEKRKATLYAQYKEELNNLLASEGDYAQIRKKLQDAIQKEDEIKQQHERILGTLETSRDGNARNAAKKLKSGPLLWIGSFGALAFVGGGILAVVGFLLWLIFHIGFIGKLGVWALAIGFIVLMITASIENKHKEELKEVSSDYQDMLGQEKKAQMERERYEDLVMKIDFIESYEAKQP